MQKMAMTQLMTASAQGSGDSIIINEILVSPNNANYDGTDWNGDGQMGTYSDQYVELYNPTDAPIDIGGWLLYTSDAADHRPCVILCGRRIPKTKTLEKTTYKKRAEDRTDAEPQHQP